MEVFDYLNILWKRKLIIFLVVSAALAFTIVAGMLTTKIYRCEGFIGIGKVNGNQVVPPVAVHNFFRITPLVESFLKERGEDISADDFKLWTSGSGSPEYVRISADSPRRQLLPALISYAAEALAESHRPIYESSQKQIDIKISNIEASIMALEKRVAEMRHVLDEEFSRPEAEKRDYFFYLNMIQDKEFQRLRLQGQLDELVSKKQTWDSSSTRLSGEPLMKPGLVKPNWKRNLIIAVLIGLFISVCLAYILEYLKMRRSLV